MKRGAGRAGLPLMAALAFAFAACGSDGDVDTATPGSTAVATTTATTAATIPATTAGPTTTAKPTAATAIVEPDSVAGIPLGSNKSAAIAVLGNPTSMGQETDLTGAKFDFLRWAIGNRALTLNYRTPSATSPLLTDWIVTGPGPVTRLGRQVGDSANQVTASYGPLQTFCCQSKVASVERGGGRLVVIVDNTSQTVRLLVGGDPGYWSRSIAD